jgi:hypothetical protein
VAQVTRLAEGPRDNQDVDEAREARAEIPDAPAEPATAKSLPEESPPASADRGLDQLDLLGE